MNQKIYDNIKNIAKNFYCFPALIEVICKHRYGIDVDQVSIGSALGIVLPSDNFESRENSFSQPVIMEEFGVHVAPDKVQQYFMSIGVNVNVEIKYESQIFDGYLASEISNMLKPKTDVICGFSYGELYRKPSLSQFGHVSLVLDVMENGRIKIFDPGPENAGVKEVDELKLYDAMHIGRNGFLMAIRETSPLRS